MSARKPLYPKVEEQEHARKQSFSEEEPELTVSEESEDDATDENVSKQRTIAGGSPSPKRRPTPQFIPESRSFSNNKAEQSSGKFYLVLLCASIGIIAIVAVKCLYGQNDFKNCKFDKLRKREPLQSDKVWKALQVGIEDLLNKRRITPNVFLFLYQDRTLRGLTQDVAQETSTCFGNKKFIEMRREDFIINNGEDYGYAIEQYKKKINEGKVLVIINLNELPAKVARALHTICDTVNPIAKDVVIFLTLQPVKLMEPNSTPIQIAVDSLYELWGKHLNSNELEPLITRVTDQVLYLQS